MAYRPAVERDLTGEAGELIALVRSIADNELAPAAAGCEERGEFPADAFATLRAAGLMTLPLPRRLGGDEVGYVVYLQVLEEIASRWASVALGISVTTLACGPVAQHGTPDQCDRVADALTRGVGAYCLSEAHAGSDPGAARARADRADGAEQRWVGNGEKAWITHAGHATFYSVFLRTGAPRELSCFLVEPGTVGLGFGAAERKMGMTASPTASVTLDDLPLRATDLVGEVGQGLPIALGALDSGRLGVAAIAVGLAQAALDYAVDYANQRETFGAPIVDHQGVAFLLADMAAAVLSARQTYLHAARLKDAGRPYGMEASIAKLVATDAAMQVTTDAVQVLGGAGYVKDHPVERYMREAKVMQIFEGTNQIQRLVIGRGLRTSWRAARARGAA